MKSQELIQKIKSIKEKKNAVIVAHNYQRPEVQDIADITGDSLELSRKTAAAKEKMIVFCGVRFMAETAKILSPEKKVLIPVENAGCQLADCITPEEVDEYRKKYPDAIIVGYVNTTAAVKAKLDYCVTSANAVDVVKKINSKKIVFLPDRNLGLWVRKNVPEKEIIIHDGRCYVHNKFLKEDVMNMKKTYPDAKILTHPECSEEVLELSDVIASTSGMLKYVKESMAKRFIIGTEEGMIHRLKKERQDAEFYPLGNAQICFNMKLITLQDVYNSLDREIVEIKLPDEIILKAKKPIDRMVEL
jgi:quinolinate synthase